MLRRQSNAPGLRERLAKGRLTGIFVKLADEVVVDLVLAAGFDFALVDLEHSQLSDGDALRLTRHGAISGLATVVRLPEVDRGLINRLLEAGAGGIQLSTVRGVDQVSRLVACTRHAPEGERSVSLAHRSAGYGAVSLREVVSAPPPLLVGQIETAETDDALEEIMSAGLDVAFAGVTDLEVDLGFDRQGVEDRVGEIRTAAAAAGIAFGAFASDPTRVPPGAEYVALSSDVAVLRVALAAAAAGAG
jgi:4-hydroxy-2-oxoheptanedioate aldolase